MAELSFELCLASKQVLATARSCLFILCGDGTQGRGPASRVWPPGLAPREQGRAGAASAGRSVRSREAAPLHHPQPAPSCFCLITFCGKGRLGIARLGFRVWVRPLLSWGPWKWENNAFIHLFRQNKHPAILLKLASFWIDRCHQFVLCHLLNIFNIASVTTQASLPSLSTH